MKTIRLAKEFMVILAVGHHEIKVQKKIVENIGLYPWEESSEEYLEKKI